MRVAADMGVAPDTAVATQVSVAALAATVELESAEELVPLPRDRIRLGFQPDGMAATGKDTTHPERRSVDTISVLLRVRKIEPLPGSLLGRHAIPVAITFRQIDPGLVLRVSPLSSRVIMREKIGIYASSAQTPLQDGQPSPAALGRDRMQPTNRGSTHKQKKDCVTGRVKLLDGTTQNAITRSTGKIASTITMIGGVIIATLSFLSVEGFGVGMMAGGIPPGVTTRTIPTTITMAPSMATMGFNPTRSLPMSRLNCSNWDIMRTPLMACWGQQLKRPSRITSAITVYQSQERSIHQPSDHSA
jgi:hypothetical protein